MPGGEADEEDTFGEMSGIHYCCQSVDIAWPDTMKYHKNMLLCYVAGRMVGYIDGFTAFFRPTQLF